MSDTVAEQALTTTAGADFPYRLSRVGTLMEPQPGNELEVEGTLNPAAGRDAEGTLWLFPRLVAEGNWSRVGRGVVGLEDGVPRSVARRGIALEPERSWEHGSDHGGTEDPRITHVPSLGVHVMTYVAFGPLGPRPALAVSKDLRSWERLGPLQFEYEDHLDVDLNLYPNKDVVFFPEIVPGPEGEPSYALLHRPMWDLTFNRPEERATLPRGSEDGRPSIWISYIPESAARASLTALARPSGHRFVAGPMYDWEVLKVGAGPAPRRVPEGWLLIHHGVSGRASGKTFELQQHMRYSAGAMILDAEDPSRVLSRSEHPLLEPTTSAETGGTVANVVFPTAIEEIDGRSYVFYGMADARIGVALLEAATSDGLEEGVPEVDDVLGGSDRDESWTGDEYSPESGAALGPRV